MFSVLKVLYNKTKITLGKSFNNLINKKLLTFSFTNLIYFIYTRISGVKMIFN
jgi:hypothetical protein